MIFVMNLDNFDSARWFLSIVDCPEDILHDLEDDLAPYIETCSEDCFNETPASVICKKSFDESVNRNNNEIEVVWTTPIRLRYLLRKIIRGYFYQMMSNAGWVHIHAGAVINSQNEVTLFIGEKCAGKTSSILACALNIKGIRLISNDRVLINKDNSYVIGYPAAVGVGYVAKDILDIKQEGHSASNKCYFLPKELGIDLAKGGRVGKIIVPAFDLGLKKMKVTCDSLEAPVILLKNVLYDTLTIDQHWEIFKGNVYVDWILKAKWCQQLTCIRLNSGGLSDEYFDILKTMVN